MQITIRPGQSIESAIKKLKKKLEADGFFDTLKRHQFFLTRKQRKRLAKRKAIRKAKLKRKQNDR